MKKVVKIFSLCLLMVMGIIGFAGCKNSDIDLTYSGFSSEGEYNYGIVNVFNTSESTVVFNASDFSIYVNNKEIKAYAFITGFEYHGGTSGSEQTIRTSTTFSVESNYSYDLKICFEVSSTDGLNAIYYKGSKIK